VVPRCQSNSNSRKRATSTSCDNQYSREKCDESYSRHPTIGASNSNLKVSRILVTPHNQKGFLDRSNQAFKTAQAVV
jgi:hypothetical protein